MDIQEQLRHAARVILQGGVFDRESTSSLLIRAARDIDSLTFTLEQWREVYETSGRTHLSECAIPMGLSHLCTCLEYAPD